MKRGLYFRLALDGMKKNRRLYLPYLLTGAGMVMIFYILLSLGQSPAMRAMKGGDMMAVILMLGTLVIALFALLFLFYTNAFLIRRRNKEFGLYNILGMNKGNISRILLWETLLSALIALGAGLICGLLFAKAAELVLLRMVGLDVGYALTVDPASIGKTVLFFGAIFALLLIASLARVRLSKPLDLLRSEAAGEKPPRAKWVVAAIGVVLLAAAYYLAVTIESPLSALTFFFAAVLLVIIATYLLFIAGSVALCKLLQRNKGYYYKSAHFVSVSSMAFRMKRNGAGLASICILATMVLVMISSSSCLYFGGENAIRERYPFEVSVQCELRDPGCDLEEAGETLRALVHEEAAGRESGMISYAVMEMDGFFDQGVLDLNGVDRETAINNTAYLLEHLRVVYVLPLTDYNRMTGTSYSLEPGEALLWTGAEAYPEDSFTVKGGKTLQLREKLDDLGFVSAKEAVISYEDAFFLIVPDWAEYASEVQRLVESWHSDLISAPCGQYCGFSLPGVSGDEQIEITARIRNRAAGMEGWGSIVSYSRAEERSDFFSLYGSLFFLGIILSIVFIAAAALIIYYKQLSEGFEDQSRFDIMQKVGMTKKEIKSAVNSQVLTVFFAPLLLAGVHLAFAFPFVQKIIRLFGVSNTPLLIGTNVVCFLIFALFYVFVYKGTARTYYGIVSGGEIKR